MSFSGAYGEANDEDSLKVLSKAIEIGCTFWDTAQVYGQGHNETLIGRFLKENPGAREKLFIGSKCGFTVSQPIGTMARTMLTSVERLQGHQQAGTYLRIYRGFYSATGYRSGSILPSPNRPGYTFGGEHQGFAEYQGEWKDKVHWFE